MRLTESRGKQERKQEATKKIPGIEMRIVKVVRSKWVCIYLKVGPMEQESKKILRLLA